MTRAVLAAAVLACAAAFAPAASASQPCAPGFMYVPITPRSGACVPDPRALLDHPILDPACDPSLPPVC